jgi:hypothetical protein
MSPFLAPIIMRGLLGKFMHFCVIKVFSTRTILQSVQRHKNIQNITLLSVVNSSNDGMLHLGYISFWSCRLPSIQQLLIWVKKVKVRLSPSMP